MSFKRLSRNSKQLLDEIMAADNPADMLAKRFDGLTNSENAELRSIIRELREEGFINVQWADNVPYFCYNQQLGSYLLMSVYKNMSQKKEPASLSTKV